MNVLVTGATTPLGRALVDHLASSPDVALVLAVGHGPVVERDRKPRLCRGAQHSRRECGGDRHTVVTRSVDLRHAREAHDLVWGVGRDLAIDVVVHAAQHRAAADRGPRVHAQNVAATRELVLACANHPTIHRLVYRSFAEVYALEHVTSDLLDEDAPLDFDPAAPQWLRDRVEADLTVCAHFGGALELAVLRCAEVLAPECGSQLWDYLGSRVCLRPFGFDPMLNVLSLDDAVAALAAAARSHATGVFNIAGADTLPLSRAIDESRRADIPVPGPLLAPLYGLRRWIAGFEFRYDMNLSRFHFGGVLDGTRARDGLGYAPRHPVTWPRSEAA